MGFGADCIFVMKNYWRAAFSVVWPIVILPVILINPQPHNRCLYVVLLMAGYWITEAVHIAITSLIPIVLFPLLNLMDTDEVCRSYMKDTTMMFVAGLILANAVEYSNLHERFALNVISLIGCGPKRLHLAIMLFTAFISMWLPNTAAVAIMLPIVASVLTELETQNIVKCYDLSDDVNAEDRRIPTKITICYYLSMAYAANIGGFGTLIGTGTNLAYKGLAETIFIESPGVDFGYFMLISTPIAVIILIFTTLLLQVWFLGLFRRKEEVDTDAAVRNVIIEKRKQLGVITFHEIAVLVCFILAICLWLTKDPRIFPGWINLIEHGYVKDGTVGIMVVLLMFCIPAKPNFFYVFSEDEEKRPKGPSSGLITWRYIQRKFPWGLIFLIGSGFAIADAARESELNEHLASWFSQLGVLPPFILMTLGCFVAALLTQITTNVVVCNITVPIMAQVAVNLQLHPQYLMYPVTIACSFAYMLPVSTPPCAMVAAACNMRTWSMASVGFVTLVISLAVLFATAPLLGHAIWNYGEFPEWAKDTSNLF